MSKFAKLFYLEPEKIQVLFYMDSQEEGVPGMRCVTQRHGQRIEVFYAARDVSELKKLWKILRRMDDEGAREFLRVATKTVDEGGAEEEEIIPEGRLH